jgi:hypothetical protein
MHLSKVNEALQHKITGGSEYGWQCWPNARWLDYESDYAHASVVFNSETQEIYTAEINDKADEHKPYRWLNPAYKEQMYQEARTRRIDADHAWDNTKWYDLETSEDWCEKAGAMFKGEEFDTRVQVPLNLEKEELYKLMEMAHERDVTLNKMVEIILEEMILRHRNDDLKR